MNLRIFAFLFLILLLLALAPVVPDQTIEMNDTIDPNALRKCLALENGRDACYASLCEHEPGYLCAEDILYVAVPAADPEKATMALYDIIASPIFALNDNGHLLMHKIGESIAKNFGSTGENFSAMPIRL